ncbi:MAG: hypothetical protein ABI372_06855 [Ginsengibacter sp.]
MMTEKQIERVKKKIDSYKKALAADKKFWGGYYHDGRAIRYLPPAQYIKIEDYNGGLRYLNWFDKHFPGDAAHSIFLFEATFILFKRGKLEAAEKTHRTFFSNIYLFDKFLGQESLYTDKRANADWELKILNEHFPYSSEQPAFIEFAEWLKIVLNSNKFLEDSKEFLALEKQLESEPAGKKRSELVDRLSQLTYG